MLGEASAHFRVRTREFAIRQARHARDVLDGVATTVVEEARVQGLTADGLKSSIGDMREGVTAAANEAAESVRARLNA
jgi:hypothetical protein